RQAKLFGDSADHSIHSLAKRRTRRQPSMPRTPTFTPPGSTVPSPYAAAPARRFLFQSVNSRPSSDVGLRPWCVSDALTVSFEPELQGSGLAIMDWKLAREWLPVMSPHPLALLGYLGKKRSARKTKRVGELDDCMRIHFNR